MNQKLKEITTGWFNVLVADEAVNALADARLNICNTCINKISMMNIDLCGLCHCPLIAKTKSPDSKCPLNLWPK